MADIFEDLTGEKPSPEMVQVLNEQAELVAATQGGQIDLASMIELVINQALSTMEIKIDLIGAHHILYGVYHEDYNAFNAYFTEWLEPIQENPVNALKSYIDMELSSSRYFAEMGEVPYLVSSYSSFLNGLDLVENRNTFVSRNFFNKFGKFPSRVQLKQCLLKNAILTFWLTIEPAYWETQVSRPNLDPLDSPPRRIQYAK